MRDLSGTKIRPECLPQCDLLYVYEDPPGIRRIRRGKGFSFIAPDDTLITDKGERQRLRSLAVPPSYENVWYCPLPNGHLQATGLDSNAKKQYFYHPHWERLRRSENFAFMRAFGEALPAFRSRIRRLLEGEDAGREQVLSAMARILDNTGIRVGGETARRRNHTYGLTTLRKDHLALEEGEIHLDFRGKGGVRIEQYLKDPKVAAVIENCVEIGGQRLFQYTDMAGQAHQVHSGDMNDFIKAHMGSGFSAKDFRTWRFSTLFLELALKRAERGDKLTLAAVLDDVAGFSGNTAAVLKSSYVHPGLLLAVREGRADLLSRETHARTGLRKAENRLLSYMYSKHAQGAIAAGPPS